MIRLLHKDLFQEELAPTYQISGQVFHHFPELEMRDDTRVHLEYVVNQYDLNPQPKLVLFVEGESEITLIFAIFKKIFMTHPGKCGIELVNLKGVNNATGNKKEDRFRAIFRLIDYLHHHQTLTFLILDRENFAEKLKTQAKKEKSLHGQGRMAVPAAHIQLWKINLEFDNFSDTEIASAMSSLAKGHAIFKQTEVKQARHDTNPGKALSNLYKTRTHYSLDKPKLATQLAAIIFNPKTRRNPANRPLIILVQIRSDSRCDRKGLQG